MIRPMSGQLLHWDFKVILYIILTLKKHSESCCRKMRVDAKIDKIMSLLLFLHCIILLSKNACRRKK